jgi:hypothetical protein
MTRGSADSDARCKVHVLAPLLSSTKVEQCTCNVTVWNKLPIQPSRMPITPVVSLAGPICVCVQGSRGNWSPRCVMYTQAVNRPGHLSMCGTQCIGMSHWHVLMVYSGYQFTSGTGNITTLAEMRA